MLYAVKRMVTPPSGMAMRIVFGAVLVGQGGMRLLHELLCELQLNSPFIISRLAYGENFTYGYLMLAIGLWLLVTCTRRHHWYGTAGAAFASAFYVWLAFAIAPTSSTSMIAAAINSIALLVEARA